MRAKVLMLAALAACTPEIVPGAYLCGPDGACPDDQACDGATNTCVLPSQVTPFACGTTTEIEPNDALASGQVVQNLACVSQPTDVRGCTQDLDHEDWYQFDVPANCTAVGVTARMTFPIAFEQLDLELVSSTGSTLATAGACAADATDDGDTRRCLDQTLTPGGHYALRVVRSGEGACDGLCAYNHYTLRLQLETP